MTNDNEYDRRLDDELGYLRGLLYNENAQVPEELIQRVLDSVEEATVQEDRRVNWRSTLPIAVVATGGLALVAASQPSLMLGLGLSLVAATYAGLLSSLLTRVH